MEIFEYNDKNLVFEFTEKFNGTLVKQECRYCFIEDYKNNLIQPCKCLGSLNFVHEKCLTNWIKKSKKPLENNKEKGNEIYSSKCEICQYPMKFQINYENNYFISCIKTLFLILSIKNFIFFILHLTIVCYFFKRLHFIIFQGISIFSEHFNTLYLIRYANEIGIFLTILFYTRDIFAYYKSIFSNQRKMIMKNISKITEK